MKNVLLIAFLLGSVSTVGAQTSNTRASGETECRLKLAQAPVIRGIRLGMTITEVLAVFPGAEKDESLRQRLSQQRFGMISATVLPYNYREAKEKFVGVRSVDFHFLDERLIQFSLIYNGPDWKSDEQFTSKVAESLNLPGIESWKLRTGSGKALACDGFEVYVWRMPESGAGTITVRSLERDADTIVREREEALKDEARRAFKP